jgi:integrase
MTNLTDRFLRSADRLKELKKDYPAGENGLTVRIGKKAHQWSIRERGADGSRKRETIGYFPIMSLAEARAIAGERAERFRHGIPVAHPAPAKPGAGLTLGDLMNRYEKARRDSAQNVKSLRKCMQVLRRSFADYAGLDMSQFSKTDMRAAHSGASDGGRHAAGVLFLRYASAMFNWAIHEDLIEMNWTKFVKRAKIKPRERVLSMDELAAIWLTTERYVTEGGTDYSRGSRDAYARMVRFLMLTGQRVSEAADLKHGHIVAGQWTQTENKSSRTLRLRLSDAALAEVGMGAHPLDRVFMSERKQGLNNLAARNKALQELSGVTGWSHHTLRHTMVTHLAEAQVPLGVTEALLNHQLGGVAGVYHHAKHEGAKKAALAQWADMVTSQVERARRAA